VCDGIEDQDGFSKFLGIILQKYLKEMYLRTISCRSRSTENVISETRRLMPMAQQNTSASESTLKNSQNTTFNAKGTREMKY